VFIFKNLQFLMEVGRKLIPFKTWTIPPVHNVLGVKIIFFTLFSRKRARREAKLQILNYVAES